MRTNGFKAAAIGVVGGMALLLALVSTAPAEGPGGSAADSAAILHVVAELDSAWNRADAARGAVNWVEDCDFVNIFGMVLPNREIMQARHHEIFVGIFRGTHHEARLRKLRFLGSDVAIADVEITVTGFKDLPPGTRPTRPGVLETRMKHVLTKVDGTWKIVATQNTAVAPGLPAAGGGKQK